MISQITLFSILYLCLCVFHFIHHSQAIVRSDAIHSLPGFKQELPSPQYSGYLQVGDTYLHYWFVLSESNPSTDPVVLWLNGGPGCSSLDGFFYELGPFEIASNNELTLRPYRWNRFANMLFLEAPVGVGFSYSRTKDYYTNDDRTAYENRFAIERFFTLYPEFKSNPFYLTGESYAGVYVPTLAEEILRATDEGTYHGAELKGIAVGNGCTGSEIGVCGWYFSGVCQGMYYSMTFLLDLPFIRQSLKTEIASACDWDLCKNNVTEDSYMYALSENCLNLLDQASVELGEINIYNVYGTCIFDSCDGPDAEVAGKAAALNNHKEKFIRLKNELKDQINRIKRFRSQDISAKHLTSVETSELQGPYVMVEPTSAGEDIRLVDTSNITNSTNTTDDRPRGPVGCIDSGAATAYLMQPEVQHAIHVIDPGFCWAVCNQAQGFEYNATRPNLPRDTYPYLISRIRVLIYNGDWDACVPYTDNAAWTENMGYETVTPWKTWFYRAQDNTSQIGGYSVVYNTTAIANSSLSYFEFRTVRGAGHMVPTDTPAQGLAVLAHLLQVPEDHIYDLSSSVSDDDLNADCNPQTGRKGLLFAVMVMLFIIVVAIILYQAKELKQLSEAVRRSQGGQQVELSSSESGTINRIHQSGEEGAQEMESVIQSHAGGNAAYFRVRSEVNDEESSSRL